MSFSPDSLTDMPRAPLSILGIGSLPFDHLLYFGPDGCKTATVEMPGGSVGNVLCALGALGERPAIASVTGEDTEGQCTLEHLEHFGVDVRWIEKKKGKQSRRVCIEVRETPALSSERASELPLEHAPDGLSCRPPDHRFVHARIGKSVVSLGALHPEPGWIKKALDMFDWFHFDATTRATRQLARLAAGCGKPVSCDFGRPPLWGIAPVWELMESCTVLKTNRPLVAILAPEDKTPVPERLFARFPRLAVLLVTDGEKDMELYWKTENGIEKTSRAVIPASRFVDAVGAGDAATACLIHAAGKIMREEGGVFTLEWARRTLEDIAALAALACQFCGATGYLYGLQKREGQKIKPPMLQKILEEIAAKGAVPASLHFPASDREQYAPRPA